MHPNLKAALQKADDKKKAGIKKKLTSGTVRQKMIIWWGEALSVAEYHPQVLTGQQEGQMMHIFKKASQVGVSLQTMPHFLKTLCTHWAGFCDAVADAQGYSKTPDAPNIGFILKNISVAGGFYKDLGKKAQKKMKLKTQSQDDKPKIEVKPEIAESVQTIAPNATKDKPLTKMEEMKAKMLAKQKSKKTIEES